MVPWLYVSFNGLKGRRSGPELRGRYLLEPTIHRHQNQARGPNRFRAVNLEAHRKRVSELLVSQPGVGRSGSNSQGRPTLASPGYSPNFSSEDPCVRELCNSHYLNGLRRSSVVTPPPTGLKFGEHIQPGALCQPANFQPGARLRSGVTARRKSQKVEISTLNYSATSRAIGLKFAELIHPGDLF